MTIKDIEQKELVQIAKDIVANLLFTSLHVKNKELLPQIFMPIILGALNDIDVEEIGMIYAKYQDALPYGLNGYPVFMSCSILNKENTKFICEKVDEIQKAIENL